MKTKEGYVIKEVNDRYIVIPIESEAVNFNGIITLNKSGKVLFEALFEEKTPVELVGVLMEKYDVTLEQAKKDVHAFLEKLIKNNLVV